MDTKKFLTGTIVGGVVFFFLGFIIYALLLESFFAANAGSATGVVKETMEWWPLALGNLSAAALLSFVFLKGSIAGFGDGAKAGLIIGFFMALAFDMIMYDTTNLMNLTAIFVDIIAFSLMNAIAGGVIGMVTK